MSDKNGVEYTDRTGAKAHVAYIRRGVGEPVVLIHGVGLQAAVWEPQIARLADEYDVIAMDMLGHGESSLPAADVGLADYAAQVLALLDGLGLDKVHLVGHSMGALISIEFARHHPDRLFSVTAMSAVFCRSDAQRAAIAKRVSDLDGRFEVEWTGTIARWFGDPLPPHQADAATTVLRFLQSCDPVGYERTYRLFAKADDAHRDSLAELAVPALFITGQDDPNSLPAMSHDMSRRAKRGVAQIVAGERHMIGVTAPTLVNDSLVNFFSRARLDTDHADLCGATTSCD